MEKPDKKQDDLLRRPLYVYDLPPEVLETLTRKTDTESQEPESIPDTPKERPQTPTVESAVGSQACSLCGLSFATVLDQRSHQKSDLHHYNLKQKLRGQKSVSETEFEKLLGNLDESLSGSDPSESDDDEDETSRKETTLSALLKKQATLAGRNNTRDGDEEEEEWGRKKKRGTGKPPLMWFGSPVLPENTYFGIYRTIFTSEELAKEEDILEAIKKRQLPPLALPKVAKDGTLPPIAYKGPYIFLCMIGGGHFAAMVVSLAPRQVKSSSAGPMNREATVLAHKTFHRYTTRRKQGGSQSANDNAKGNAHSAGSSLRRYNEQALVDDVRQLLQDWKGLLDTSDLLFVRATGATNRRTLFGPYDGQVLNASDPRLRGFPFSTRRATQNELMRSFIELTRLKVREIVPVDPSTAIDEKAKPQTPNKPVKPAAPKLSEEEETAQLHTTQLQALIRRSKLPALLSYLKTNSLPPTFRFQPLDANHHAPTPLHLAAAQNSAPLVTGLLTRGGADPTLANDEGKLPFELAGDRATRDAFRVARQELGETTWDWEVAKVPAPMKREEAEKRDERERKEADRKEAERRRAEEERLKREGPKVNSQGSGRKGGVLGGGIQKSAEERRQEEARGLTTDQRIKLERERRARAAEERLRRMQGSS
ncbi:putative ankyrin repeat-containing protein [Phaeoacremonium minimum UCRPA7]|uniref:Putative ankyrin repeat-containing protein n=1 Tax=Phaeoacremonium minimum (strain UCR-PA7) TaxID=1286976 RepID=R8BK28_PHAM7|nr:putative ankyrin repeat-containing protein [Phaeoacremonium minimum UCRPA7]EON99639.1 putative ankyrin repeat-containing protein [Phaeoacremonium minimum UCRPA7]